MGWGCCIRNSLVDVAKGIAIIAVVLGHSRIVTQADSWASRLIDGFPVPVFFFLSGVFFSYGQFRQKFLKRTESYLKPYVVASIIALAIFYAKKGVHLYWGFSFLYANGDSILWPWSPIWFLPHLWVVWVAAVGLTKFARWNEIQQSLRIALVVVLMIIGGMLIQRFKQGEDSWSSGLPFVGLPLSIDLLPLSLSYFLLGSLIKKRLVDSSIDGRLVIGVLPLWICLQLFVGDPINLNARLYDDVFLGAIKACAGIIMVVSLSAAAVCYRISRDLISKIGEASLLILIFHALVQDSVEKYLVVEGADSGVVRFLGLCASVAIPYLMHVFAVKNRFIGRLFFAQ